MSNGFDYFERLLHAQTGYTYSIMDKAKTLSKFGRTLNADNGVKTTVADFQGAVVNETFATANTIDSVVCSTSDIGNVTIEGHTIDTLTGHLTFRVQTVVLTGQTPAALAIPLARATGAYRTNGTYASPATDLTGNVYVYDSALAGGVTGGTPNTASATKCMIVAGNNQSTKCATSISATDSWVVTHFLTGLSRQSGTATIGDFSIEVRETGGVWKPVGTQITISTTGTPFAEINFETPVIVPPNSDVRAVVVTNNDNSAVFAEISGPLVKRVGLDGLS